MKFAKHPKKIILRIIIFGKRFFTSFIMSFMAEILCLPPELIVSIGILICHPKDYLSLSLTCKKIGKILSQQDTIKLAQQNMAKITIKYHPKLQVTYQLHLLPNGYRIHLPIIIFPYLGKIINPSNIEKEYDIIYDTFSQEKKIKFASLTRWIEYMIFYSQKTKEIIKVYTRYMTTKELMWLLYSCIYQSETQKTYDETNIKRGKVKILSILIGLITNRHCPNKEIIENNELNNDFLCLAKYCNGLERIQKILERKKVNLLENNSLVDKKVYFSILDIPNDVFIDYYTNLDLFYLQNIQYSEFMDMNWTKKDKEQNSPNIIKLINQFGKLSHEFQSHIFNISCLEQRCLLIYKFKRIVIDIIKNSKIPNFNFGMAICSLLGFSSLHRLKKHNEFIQNNFDCSLFDEALNCFAPDRFFLNLRNEMNKFKQCIPYLGIILSELTFVFDGGVDYGNISHETGCNVRVSQLDHIYQILDNFIVFSELKYDPKYEIEFLLIENQDEPYMLSLSYENRADPNVTSKILDSPQLQSFYDSFIQEKNDTEIVNICFPIMTSVDDVNQYLTKNGEFDVLSTLLDELFNIFKLIEEIWVDFDKSSLLDATNFRSQVILPLECRIFYILSRPAFSELKDKIHSNLRQFSICPSLNYFFN